jgi:pimeloyl-ACP methyl ester carboxylesterase
MPKLEIRNRMVNYVQKGKGIDLVFLHGWGQNIEMMMPCADHFEQDFRVTVLDFQGHGESEEPECAWSVQDYADAL